MNTLVEANLSCLTQGLEFLEGYPGTDYEAACPDIFNSSIGGHFRHNLDHYACFLAGYGTGSIDYDARERDIQIETEKEAAMELLETLREGLEQLMHADLDMPLQVRMDDGGDSSWSQTSLRRELQFLLSHSIHHYALIVAIASRRGYTKFPEGFGIAPSTLNFRSTEKV